jgi:diguanylate cyclase (GGDEF)-like protein/PAS domain S-box-containing protein
VRPLLIFFLVAIFGVVCTSEAFAIESIRVPLDAQAIDLTQAVEHYASQGDTLEVSTAPGADGIVRRIEVSARTPGAHPSWIVFALTNDSDEQIERLIVAPHFRLVGSGVIWPDLGSTRIAAITASQGFAPERQDSDDSDVFRLTLDPGTTVTYVAELHTPNLPQIYLWQPDAYKDKVASLTLYKGIVIGIAGLLALFLTIVFVVKGAVIFPAAAALAWSVLAYVCIDFGFWNKLFGVAGAADQVWRAGAEAILAATLLVFLFAYLNLSRWHVRASHVAMVWLVFLAALVGLAVYDAPVAAGVARISLATVASVGFILVTYLALHGYERAIMLIPTWFLLLAWVCAAALTVLGVLTNDLVSPALVGGLVLIVMLIGFTIMQNAFVAGGLASGAVSDPERRALALTGAGDIVFDWDTQADRIYVSPEAEHILGLRRGALEGPASSWFDLLHSADRDRYSACLDTVLEQRRGRIILDFRLRGADGHYSCFQLKARPVVSPEGEVVRVVGTLADVTDAKNAEERLLQDAVRDNLTGLPNRELFLDRLDRSLIFARNDANAQPAVLAIDFDKFRRVNAAVGMAAGDSILLTLARRLSRQIKPEDTLARIASDQFAIILLSESGRDEVLRLAENVRGLLSAPVNFADKSVATTASIGVALFDSKTHLKREDMLRDAEIAVARVKLGGGDRVEIFRPGMRAIRADRAAAATDLRRALDRGEIRILFQPVVRLADRTVAGFEALLRWEHLSYAKLSSSEILALAEEHGLAPDIGVFALERTARELAAWQQALDVTPPIFAVVDMSSHMLLRHDLVHDAKAALTRSNVLQGTLRLAFSQRLVMDNPEFSAQILQRLRDVGAGLSLFEFGAGHSSLAHLQRVPFQDAKIDKSFLRPDAKGMRPPMLRSLVRLTHELGMDAVADAVETESDAIEHSQLGCEFAVGPIFGEPMGALEARRLVGAATEVAA